MTTNMNANKAAIQNAFIKKLMVCPLRKIYVKDIVEEAGVCKVTFYNNFNNIEDLLEKMEEQVFNDLFQLVVNNRDKLDNDDYYTFFLYVADYIKEHKDFFLAITSKNGDLNFQVKLKEEITKIFNAYRAKTIDIIPEQKIYEEFVLFIIGGVCECFIDWIKKDCHGYPSKSIRKLVKLFTF